MSSSVTTSMADSTSGFILAGFMASKNADLFYFGEPWRDYQCHSETTSNQPHYQFEVQLLGLGPWGFPSFLDFDVQCEVLFRVLLIIILGVATPLLT